MPPKTETMYDVYLAHTAELDDAVQELKEYLEKGGMIVSSAVETRDRTAHHSQDKMESSRILCFCVSDNFEVDNRSMLEFRYALIQKKTVVCVELTKSVPSMRVNRHVLDFRQHYVQYENKAALFPKLMVGLDGGLEAEKGKCPSCNLM